MTADEQINEKSLRRLTNHLIEGGCTACSPWAARASSGRFSPTRSSASGRRWSTRRTGRVPVYAGTVGVTTRETIELTRLAEKAGVDAVSILTPYFISPNDDQLFDHYQAVAESSSLPILLYTNPARTGRQDLAGPAGAPGRGRRASSASRTRAATWS